MKRVIAAFLLLVIGGCVPSYWPYGHENPNEKKGSQREESRDEKRDRDREHRNSPDEERDHKGDR